MPLVVRGSGKVHLRRVSGTILIGIMRPAPEHVPATRMVYLGSFRTRRKSKDNSSLPLMVTTR